MEDRPWYTNFRSPKSSPATITDDKVSELLCDLTKIAGNDYIVIDVRRTDFGAIMRMQFELYRILLISTK